MSTQSRTSEQSTDAAPRGEEATTPEASAGASNLLQRWVRLVQSSSLWGNDAGQLRLEDLATGPNTPRIQTLEEVRAARAQAVAKEDAAEAGAESTSWWEDAVCAEAEPEHAEMPPIFTLPPVVAPPVLPAVGEGLLSRILAFGARWLGPVVAGMWPKDTAPPELTDRPYTGMDPGVWPEAVPRPEDDNKCEQKEVDHRGGHRLHDMCADTLPGNDIPGHDLWVRTPAGEEVTYDAASRVNKTVWEVKTDRYGTWADWVKRRHLAEQVEAFRRQNRIARECALDFKISVSDAAQFMELLVLLGPEGISVEHREDCPRDEP